MHYLLTFMITDVSVIGGAQRIEQLVIKSDVTKITSAEDIKSILDQAKVNGHLLTFQPLPDWIEPTPPVEAKNAGKKGK